MIMLVTHKDALACASHAMLCIVFFESLQSRKYRGVLFWLAILGSECIVAKREQADGFGLIAVEVLGDDGPVLIRVNDAVGLLILRV